MKITAFFACFVIVLFSAVQLLPVDTYWDELAKLGASGRIAHYLIIDSEAFGNEVTQLDEYFSNKYTPEEYENLQHEVILSMPTDDLERRLLNIFTKVSKVKDPKTGKTLGDAFRIFYNLQDDPKVIHQIDNRLDSKDPLTSHTFHPHETLKDIILENPEAIINILQDPEILNVLTNTVVQHLSSDKAKNNIKLIQDIIVKMEIAYSKIFEEHGDSLLSMKDEESGTSLGNTLKSLTNIIETTQFAQNLKNFLTPSTIESLHKRTEKIFIQEKQKISPPELYEFFKINGLSLSSKNAERILQLSDQGELAPNMIIALEYIYNIPDLDTKKISELISSQGYLVTPETVEVILEIMYDVTVEDAADFIDWYGLSESPRKVKTIIDLLKKIKNKCNRRDDKPATPLSTDKKVISSAESDFQPTQDTSISPTNKSPPSERSATSSQINFESITEENPLLTSDFGFDLVDEALASATARQKISSKIQQSSNSVNEILSFEASPQMPHEVFDAINEGQYIIKDKSRKSFTSRRVTKM